MANQLAANPWLIDTPSATPMYLGTMHAVQIEYIDYTADTDTVEIQDRDGRVIALLNGAVDLRTVRTGRMGWVYGLKVPLTDSLARANMAHGRILVYFE